MSLSELTGIDRNCPDIEMRGRNVRFTPESGHWGLSRAISAKFEKADILLWGKNVVA